MARFIIEGGRRIGGEHSPPGNKNAALPMLAACVLTDEPVCLTHVPRIEDVRTMLEILEGLGADVTWRGHTVTVRAGGIRRRRLNPDLCRRVRSSILFAGPMSARHGGVTISPPGGDVIGRRRVDTHFDALRRLGIEVSGREAYRFRAVSLHGADIILDEASVTATENILMAAARIPARTTLYNAACEPHIQALCRMLNAMGAHIKGIGSNFLTIQGTDVLGGGTFRVPPDTVDAVSFMAAAALTGGSLTVRGISADEFRVVGPPLERLGLRWRIDGDRLHLPARQTLRIRDDFGGAIPKIDNGPWPSFPADLMSVSIVLATQAQGTILFFDKMFESRMYFVDRLIEMNARIVQCDPHRVLVTGPAALTGSRLSSPDIRAGMALLLAALAARGTSIIENAQSIDRGYESVEQRLRALGAAIVREP